MSLEQQLSVTASIRDTVAELPSLLQARAAIARAQELREMLQSARAEQERASVSSSPPPFATMMAIPSPYVQRQPHCWSLLHRPFPV